MSVQLTSSDTQDFINASNAVYYREGEGLPNLTALCSSGNDAEGFYATAFFDEADSRIIIAYEGTSDNNATYETATHIAFM